MLKAGSHPEHYQFRMLSRFPEIRHAVFTRRSGCSAPPYDSMNVGFSTGDAPRAVAENRGRIAEHFNAHRLVSLHQVHGTEIVVVPDDLPEDPPPTQGDAMICRTPGIYLLIQVADCQPVMLYDPCTKTVANIHSGWKGSIDNIIGKTIRKMTSEFGSCPADIRAGIGPSLGPCCAEFIHYRTELPESFWKYGNARHYFDFWRISRDQLIDAGIRKDHIRTSGLCTRCRKDLFFSYRRKKVTGRFAAVIGLRGNGGHQVRPFVRCALKKITLTNICLGAYL